MSTHRSKAVDSIPWKFTVYTKQDVADGLSYFVRHFFVERKVAERFAKDKHGICCEAHSHRIVVSYLGEEPSQNEENH